MTWWAWLLVVTILSGVIYWLFVLTEGAYLGPRVVVFLYDRFARRYDAVKQFSPADEAYFLGLPVAQVGDSLGRDLLILDVATGTGRFPLASLTALAGRGQVVALDRSRSMLAVAQTSLAWLAPNVTWVQSDAQKLPFAGALYDVVACLEALEFMAQPSSVLNELLRVLQPGGLLVISNRVSWQARLMPGKAFRREELVHLLRSLGAIGVETRPWQVDYDLVLARKPGMPGLVSVFWEQIVRCAGCQGQQWHSSLSTTELSCKRCDWQWVNEDGIWKARQVIAR